MFSNGFGSKPLLFLVVLGLLIAPVLAKRKSQQITMGSWGGPNVRMDVGEKSAKLEFACAHGTIDEPLIVDDKGQFSWKGTFSAERGGPSRIDETPKAQAAVY